MTKVMLAQVSILTWQSFIRTSHKLSSRLAEIIPDKRLLAWRNPVKTNQFLEILNWHAVWYKPWITTCQFLISDRRDAHNANHRLNLEPCSKGGTSQFSSSWSVTAGTYTIANHRLNLGPCPKDRRRKSEFQSRWDAFYTQIPDNSS